MENVEVAKVLEDYADLLDIRGGKPFKVRSYRQAANTVAGLSRPITDVIDAEEETLDDLPAIGESVADHIREIDTDSHQLEHLDVACGAQVARSSPVTALERSS